MKYDIDFLEQDRLYSLCNNVIETLQEAITDKEKTLHKNIIDPFSAIFDASFRKISLTEWIELEKVRQIQKTFQNAIGTFHQKLLGSIEGWEDFKDGKVFDIINKDKKVIAEIKNKFNTTKGNHKVKIYDDFSKLLKKEYKGYTAYYVPILTKKRLNRPFTPSDNTKTKSDKIIRKRRPENKSIIEIDGKSFYEIVTGDSDAIYKIYKAIPHILSDILNSNTLKSNTLKSNTLKSDSSNILLDPLFKKLFERAFK